MASKATPRSLQSLSRQAHRSCSSANQLQSRSIRSFSASTSKPEPQHETESTSVEQPRWRRWAQTPARMKAPFPTSPRRDENTKPFTCNEDPAILDEFYIKFLGRGGDKVLTDEIKWLAITHKSFDQGRRGYNDRLAFFGRRILNLQASLALINSPVALQSRSRLRQGEGPTPNFPHDDREPFIHSALDGLANLSNVPMGEILNKSRLSQLGMRSGMKQIIRWVPRMKNDLGKSGLDVVLTTTVYAIIGAIALQRGGDVAATVARERVLKPLGIS